METQYVKINPSLMIGVLVEKEFTIDHLSLIKIISKELDIYDWNETYQSSYRIMDVKRIYIYLAKKYRLAFEKTISANIKINRSSLNQQYWGTIRDLLKTDKHFRETLEDIENKYFKNPAYKIVEVKHHDGNNTNKQSVELFKSLKSKKPYKKFYSINFASRETGICYRHLSKVPKNEIVPMKIGNSNTVYLRVNKTIKSKNNGTAHKSKTS